MFDFLSPGIRRATLAAATIAPMLSVAPPAEAREDYCLVPHTRTIDQRATATYRQLEQTANPRFMTLLTGVWFIQTNSQQTGQQSNQYQKFERNGLWQYQDQTCTSGGFCSRSSGVGLFAVRADPNVQNGFFGLIIVSDSSRDHQCTSFRGRFINQNLFVFPSGQPARRVQ